MSDPIRFPPGPPSPGSPTGLSDQGFKGQLPRSLYPTSPPTPHGSPAEPPRGFSGPPSAVTPPASVPMSAQPSQSSVTSAPNISSLNEDFGNSEEIGQVGRLQPPGFLELGRRSSSHEDLKRSRDDASEDSPSKRQRTQEPVAESTPAVKSSADNAAQTGSSIIISGAEKLIKDSTSDPGAPSQLGLELPKSISPPRVADVPKVGQYYLFDRKLIPKPDIHVSQNLISLFGLDDIAKSVERRNPVTGEKTNRLRKSYENHIKDFPGRNKAVSRPGEFAALLEIPEENWQADHVAGREIYRGFPETLMKNLERLEHSMEPGTLPLDEDAKWRNALSLDEPMVKSSGQQPPAKGNLGKTPVQDPTTASVESERPRPLRRGTQRSYNDSSFEGYNEAFDDGSDDEPMAAAYGGKDGGSRGGKKGRQVGTSTRKDRRKRL